MKKLVLEYDIPEWAEESFEKQLKRFKGSHMIDIDVRKDGQNYHMEGDWLKYINLIEVPDDEKRIKDKARLEEIKAEVKSVSITEHNPPTTFKKGNQKHNELCDACWNNAHTNIWRAHTDVEIFAHHPECFGSRPVKLDGNHGI